MTDEADGPAENGSNGYDALADRDADGRDEWASPWGDNPLQRYHSWPVTRGLLPDVSDARLLDAGCGVGDHVEEFLDAGATVVGADASERAVEIARERFGDRATFREADLAEPLDFADADEFDVICSHLVLDHLEDWRPAFEEFHRVLAPGGTLVLATVHPMQYYLAYEGVTSYYDATPVELGWDAPVTSYHRPLAAVLNPLVEANFRLDRFEEPRPSDEYVERAADEWQVAERPQILAVRAVPA